MVDYSDWDLIERSRDGDQKAFELLVNRYHRPIIHFCQRMIGSREDAEDIAQECFVRVHRYLGRLKPSAKFSTLLFAIARNLTLNFIRDSGRRGRGVTFSLTTEENEEKAIEDTTHSPVRAARLNELEQMIVRAMDMLSPEHREVLLLREIEGKDYNAISEITRCNKGTVKSRIARARQQLRMHLERMGAGGL